MARKVLLADDSVTAQNMGRRILTDAGYEVVTVNNGSAALKKIAEQKPDIIVLDVYMPGYGGLEVCQRLKETRETARIPVLLTVGKLEPFKAEEARRARADAYIVKPFEASELLTALTKLEDKIVPGPEPHKPGRFAKALAAVAESDAEAEAFGDKETGWRERLIIPSGEKPAVPEPERTPIPIGSHRLSREEDFKPAEPKGFERPLPAGLPADITPEEISAISAAAAVLNGATETQASNQQAVAEKARIPVDLPSTAEAPLSQGETAPSGADPVTAEVAPGTESAAATFASAPESADTAQPVIAGAEEKSADKAPQPQPEVAAEVAPTNADLGEPTQSESPVVATGSMGQSASESEHGTAEKHTDAEVLAALAMLGVPSENQGASLVTAHASGGNGRAHGPRWVAEPVAVETHEAGLILEHEMQATFAATAAYEAGKARSAAVLEVMDSPALEAGQPDFAPAVGADPGGDQQPPPQEEDIALAAISKAVTAEEEESSAVQAVPQPATVAYAAAASAGSERAQFPVADTSAAAPFSAPSLDSSIASAASVRDAEQPAPLLDPDQSGQADTTPVAEKAAESSASTPTEAQVSADSSAAEPASGPEDPSAISSLVDNMLAELKPKLMEELTKKLAKGKKP